jgi:hypothetical protein
MMDYNKKKKSEPALLQPSEVTTRKWQSANQEKST